MDFLSNLYDYKFDCSMTSKELYLLFDKVIGSGIPERDIIWEYLETKIDRGLDSVEALSAKVYVLIKLYGKDYSLTKEIFGKLKDLKTYYSNY